MSIQTANPESIIKEDLASSLFVFSDSLIRTSIWIWLMKSDPVSKITNGCNMGVEAHRHITNIIHHRSVESGASRYSLNTGTQKSDVPSASISIAI